MDDYQDQQIFDDSGKPLSITYDDNGNPIQPKTEPTNPTLWDKIENVGKSAWNLANTPLTSKLDPYARMAGAVLGLPAQLGLNAIGLSNIGNKIPGASSEVASQVNKQVNPINIALAATGLGEAGYAGKGIATAAPYISRALSAPFAAEGVNKVINEPGTIGKTLGGVEALLGAQGATPETFRPAVDFVKSLIGRAPVVNSAIDKTAELPDWLNTAKQTELAKPDVQLSEAKPEPTSLEEAQNQAEQEFTKTNEPIFNKHTPDSIATQIDKIPAVANGDVIKPSPDIVNSTPVKPVVPSDLVIPRAGQAIPTRDVNLIGSELYSPDKVLLNNPTTKDVAEPIITAQDEGSKWERAQNDEFAKIIKGLNKDQLANVADLLKGQEVPGIGGAEEIAAQNLRDLLNNAHAKLPADAGPGGNEVGYITDYLTRLAKKDGSVKSIVKYFFGKDNPIYQLVHTPEMSDKEGELVGDLYSKGHGNPSSPFVKPRTGKLSDVETNLKTIIPAYFAGIRKDIFNGPAVRQATEALKSVPDGTRIKDMASGFINNFSRYDSEAQLHNAWNRLVGPVANTTARAVVDFNPGIHSLHLAELPASIWPELGTKYTAQGFAKVMNNPASTWNEVARLGLIQGEMKPWAIKSAPERWQSAGQFFNMAERFVKGVGYAGAKQMFLDKGMSESDAAIRALRLAKDMTYQVDPARQMRFATPESNVMGGVVGSTLGQQFKNVPMKIVEQYKNIIKNSIDNPKAAMRLLQGAGLMAGISTDAMRTFHVSPTDLLKMSPMGAFGSAMAQVGNDLMVKHDWEKALIDTMSWTVPGGRTLHKLISF